MSRDVTIMTLATIHREVSEMDSDLWVNGVCGKQRRLHFIDMAKRFLRDGGEDTTEFEDYVQRQLLTTDSDMVVDVLNELWARLPGLHKGSVQTDDIVWEQFAEYISKE
jgi:hypothetical protein